MNNHSGHETESHLGKTVKVQQFLGQIQLGKRKGSLKETLSYALHKDDFKLYSVTFRDLNLVKTETLEEFLQREEADIPVPITRILSIIREGKIVWRKGQKEISVKSGRL